MSLSPIDPFWPSVTFLTYAQAVAGDVCHGCGLPLMDRVGRPWKYRGGAFLDSKIREQEDTAFRAAHRRCGAGRWSLMNGPDHCFRCCPPAP